MPTNDARTPNGLPCWIAGKELAEMIQGQARGCYQKEVAKNLIQQGYVIGYKSTGSMLKGRAKQYSSHYKDSLYNLMNRIEEILPATLTIERGPVGPKGAIGYRLII